MTMPANPDQISAITNRLTPFLTRLTTEQADGLLVLGDTDYFLTRLVGYLLESIQVEQTAPSNTPDIITLTLGDHTYDLVPFLQGDEISVSGYEMVNRAERLNANVGEDDGRYILAHETEIPENLRDKFTLVFTAWRCPDDPSYVAFSRWGDEWGRGKWSLSLLPLFDQPWHKCVRLVRRHLPTAVVSE